MKLKTILILVLLLFCSVFNTNAQVKTEVNVMTFNIRYDNPEDGINAWRFRKDNALKMLLFYDVDVIGMQEVLVNQLNDIKTGLKDYAVVGVGREDGKEKGEFCPVFYNKNKYELIKSGYFWLSQTPDKPLKGWDAACERIATWTQLKDKKTGGKFFILNTHLDHIGKIARLESITLLKNKISQLSEGLPQIIIGDFNSEPESIVIKALTTPDKKLSISNSKLIAELQYGPTWSFHDFGKIPLNYRTLIDYIFVSKPIKVSKYAVIGETLNSIYLSDHAPVFAKVVF